METLFSRIDTEIVEARIEKERMEVSIRFTSESFKLLRRPGVCSSAMFRPRCGASISGHSLATSQGVTISGGSWRRRRRSYDRRRR